MRHPKASILALAIVTILLYACAASNCPLESTVTCNYTFYDSEGTAVSYNDYISVSTLLPGTKTVYIYKALGHTTVTLDHQDSSYIRNGFTETVSTVRRDTTLINNLENGTGFKLPMSYFNDKDTLIISYSAISNKDTIIVSHDSYSFVELPECGTQRFHTIKDVSCTESGLWGIEISNPKVNYDGNENIKLYFNGTAE